MNHQISESHPANKYTKKKLVQPTPVSPEASNVFTVKLHQRMKERVTLSRQAKALSVTMSHVAETATCVRIHFIQPQNSGH